MDLQLVSWREGLFYAHELDLLLGSHCGEELNRIRNLREAEDYLRDILFNVTYAKAEEVLKKLGKDTNQFDDRHPLTTHLKSKFSDEEQLPDSAYQWIEDNQRACAFSYHFLQKMAGEFNFRGFILEGANGYRVTPKDSRSALTNTNRKPNYHEFIKSHNLIRTPHVFSRESLNDNHSERLTSIKLALKNSEVSLENQKYLISLLRDAWKEVLSNSSIEKFHRWLTEDSCLKSKYINKYFTNKYNNFTLSWKPVDDSEEFTAIHAHFDYYFLINHDITEARFHQARSAWNQRKFQNKNKGTKSRSISMSERTNKRLDWLAKNKDEKINAVIKKLIDLEFEHSGGPSKL
ncbi:hypothetical protein MD535_11125 [Vibrio sp. ZSDZ65]|uniref:Uncharacterized protein n=1 Tax=Vibrio qingdaonensis TaxID=2829491 RepID=A0A9X3HWT8_9VIBR|nr:hypothetical protein [Vibrio qingdaonensis]MCW8346553.1 hypothetical protein [Vibrio qingdaonensis]